MRDFLHKGWSSFLITYLAPLGNPAIRNIYSTYIQLFSVFVVEYIDRKYNADS